MALNLLSLAGLVGFSQLFVLGIYLYRRGRIERRIDKPPGKVPVQPNPMQVKVETSKLQNGRSKMSDIAEKALAFLNGKKEEELEATPT